MPTATQAAKKAISTVISESFAVILSEAKDLLWRLRVNKNLLLFGIDNLRDFSPPSAPQNDMPPEFFSSLYRYSAPWMGLTYNLTAPAGRAILKISPSQQDKSFFSSELHTFENLINQETEE